MTSTADRWRGRKRRATVLGTEMAHVEASEGDPIVLLHGNPTSSFLWRDVLPALEGRGRCIVPRDAAGTAPPSRNRTTMLTNNGNST